MRFALPRPRATLGLPCGKHVFLCAGGQVLPVYLVFFWLSFTECCWAVTVAGCWMHALTSYNRGQHIIRMLWCCATLIHFALPTPRAMLGLPCGKHVFIFVTLLLCSCCAVVDCMGWLVPP
jgi:hypothetical protein